VRRHIAGNVDARKRDLADRPRLDADAEPGGDEDQERDRDPEVEGDDAAFYRCPVVTALVSE
jgi:hypothetical protein